jgi:putative NADH-flavin reductase
VKILVFGATGPTGKQVVTQAFSQGHTVTAFVRKPELLPIVDPRLRLIVGDTTGDSSTIAEAVRDQDFVISALGRGQKLKSENLIARSMRLIVPAMEQLRVRRLIMMSAFGVGESHTEAPLIPRIIYRAFLKDLFADKKAAEDRVRLSSLDWTIVRPVMLTHGPLTGNYRVATRLDLKGVPKISRADVAHFMLAEATGRAFVRKTAAISY